MRGSVCRLPEQGRPLEIGRGRVLREGDSIAILNFGARLGECLKAADDLAARGVTATIADARFAKPLDRELILRLAREHEVLMTVEEGSVGGFASHVLELLAGEGVLDRGLKFRPLVLPDVFVEHDSPANMYAAAALDAPGIAAAALTALKKERIPLAGEIGPGKRLA